MGQYYAQKREMSFCLVYSLDNFEKSFIFALRDGDTLNRQNLLDRPDHFCQFTYAPEPGLLRLNDVALGQQLQTAAFKNVS